MLSITVLRSQKCFLLKVIRHEKIVGFFKSKNQTIIERMERDKVYHQSNLYLSKKTNLKIGRYYKELLLKA